MRSSIFDYVYFFSINLHVLRVTIGYEKERVKNIWIKIIWCLQLLKNAKGRSGVPLTIYPQ